MNQLTKHMHDLPLEIYSKIMYKSGICSPEAQLIKDMNNHLPIKFEDIVYMEGGLSYTKHLVNMGFLRDSIECYGYGSIEYIYFIG